MAQVEIRCVIHIPYYNNNVRLNVIFQQCVIDIIAIFMTLILDKEVIRS